MIGETQLSFEIVVQKCVHRVFVTSKMNRPCILWRYFLEKHNASLNFTKTILKLNGLEMKLRGEKEITSTVRSLVDVVLRLHTMNIIPSRLQLRLPRLNESVLMVAFHNYSFLQIVHIIQLLDPDINGRISVTLINDSNKYMRIKKGEIIAQGGQDGQFDITQ